MHAHIALLGCGSIGFIPDAGLAARLYSFTGHFESSDFFIRPNLRFSILRCAIQAASGRTAVAGCPPVLRATDMPTHSVLSHIKGQNALDCRLAVVGRSDEQPSSRTVHEYDK
jgi:hypothetical protein